MKLHNPRNGHPKGELGRFYRDALDCLQQAGFRFLICGGYAFEFYTGIQRRTKDIDLFVLPQDVRGILDALQGAGYRSEVSEPNWISKVYSGQDFIDIIHNSGNGLCPVDESWFAHGEDANVLDLTVQIAPVEEMVWQKCFIMVRHRFDGADVAHLIHARGDRLDWGRLVDRFGDHWPVLLSHLILFEYIYPSQKSLIPRELIEELLDRQLAASRAAPDDAAVCRGTLLSNFDFQADVREWEYLDPREGS
ncbi:MAG: nucleotidyltransferase family protein [Planctomycetes bacterium]|nr:nucleotidyltransferase family protein [Planctomycetota bacterium]